MSDNGYEYSKSKPNCNFKCFQNDENLKEYDIGNIQKLGIIVLGLHVVGND